MTACTLQTISDELRSVRDDLLVAHITVLAQFARVAPEAFEEKSDVIMAFLMKKVLLGPAPVDMVSEILFESSQPLLTVTT